MFVCYNMAFIIWIEYVFYNMQLSNARTKRMYCINEKTSLESGSCCRNIKLATSSKLIMLHVWWSGCHEYKNGSSVPVSLFR